MIAIRLLLSTAFVSTAFVLIAALLKDGSPPETAGATSIVRPGIVSSEYRPHRLWLKGKWRHIGGVRSDSLLDPQLIDARGGSIVLFDYGDRRLKAFARGGELLWTIGKRGFGPWEFNNPTDLQIAPNGDVWVADPENARVSIIRADGRPVRMIEVGTQMERIIPLNSEDFLGLANKPFFTRYNLRGERVSELPLPPALRGVSMITAEPFVRPGPTGGAAIAFRWSGRLIVVGLDGAVKAGTEGIEPLPFPETKSYKINDPAGREMWVFRPDPKATWAAHGVAVQGARVLVLFRGETRSAGKILDVYDLNTANYLGSMLLAEPPSAIAALGSDLALLYDEPKPHVDVVRWQSQP